MRHIELKKLPLIFKLHDLERLGFSKNQLRGLLKVGKVERVAWGLYRARASKATDLETIALVCKKVPQAVVCLFSALRVQGIGTQAPREVWIALDRKARVPTFSGLPVRIIRFSGQMLHYGVVSKDVQGVPVKITTPARTVVDCFRYRRKIGTDVALEALRDVLHRRLASRDELIRAAEKCRARTVMRPYLEALSS